MERYDPDSINMEIRDIDKRMEEIEKFFSGDKYHIELAKSGHIKLPDLTRERNDLINRKDILNLKLAVCALQDK